MNRSKRKTILFLILLMVLCSLSGCRSKKQEYRTYSGSVSVRLGLGKEGMLTDTIPFPVTVLIEGDYAREGCWCVLTVPTNGDDYYAYREALTEEPVQRIQYIVPAAVGSAQLTVEVLDDQSRVIYSRTCTYRANQWYQDAILCGSMGSQTDTVAWPDTVTQDEAEIEIRTVALTEDNWYDREEGYLMLDFLTVDASFFRQLDAGVQEALLAWTEHGGCLVLEGKEGKSLLEELEPDMGEAQQIHAGGSVRLTCILFGRSSIWLAEEPLSQLVPRLTDEQKSDLLLSLVSGASGSYSESCESGKLYQEEALTDLIAEHKVSARTPNVWIYAILLGVYLVIGIPGIYLLVRRKNRTHWFRPLVCVLAVVFSGIIFIISGKTRYSEPFFHTLTILTDDTSQAAEQIYAGVQAPFNSSFQISISPEYDVKAMMNQAVWTDSTNSGNRRRTAEITCLEDQTALVLGNLTAFSPRYFQLSRSAGSPGSIYGSLKITENGLIGTVTNETEYELVSAVIVCEGQLALAEHWQPGETMDLAEQQKAGRVHLLTKEQFLDGAYENRGKWIGSLSDYYEYLLYISSEAVYVMAEIDYTPQFQAYTGYPVENDTLVVLPVKEESEEEHHAGNESGNISDQKEDNRG